ncbi:threonine ammonia-lyase [Kibdelosporangium aridum]|uniref:Threonine dehydratase n=1 Tax=Kibdelosporangium aridum TaxID=2030 RepID=A0A1Y5XD77_KIBAR|nr:pyridoxal-phosphate dependent enzyme [Kibdelosporangium aridum]SMC86634.1 threonine dehydratase [Kibdelosporangium aridum]
MDLRLDRIDELSRTIDPEFRDSPQFTVDLDGRPVLVKIETMNPLRCFKGRGASAFAASADPGMTVVVASSGNFGQAMAYACGKRGIAIEVFLPEDVNPTKLAAIRSFGAKVHLSGVDTDATKKHAREYAAERPDRLLVRDGAEPLIAEGAGTIAVELLRHGPLDTVVVQIGDGALINGIARWIKANSPSTRVVGVCSTGAPAMLHSWRTGEPVEHAVTTIAEGIAIGSPLPESVRWMRKLVDDIVLVDDSALFTAMGQALRGFGVLLEPSGAAGLAAIPAHDLPGERIAVVLTGGNTRPGQLEAIVTA